MIHNISLLKLTKYNTFSTLLLPVSQLNTTILQGILYKSLYSIRIRKIRKAFLLWVVLRWAYQQKILENLLKFITDSFFIKLTSILSFPLLCLPVCQKYVDIKEELKMLVTIT